MSTRPENSTSKKQFSRRQQWLICASVCTMAAAMIVEVVAITWDRSDRTKRLDQLELELKQLQKAVDERKKHGGDKHLAPVKVKQGASSQKANEFHPLLPRGKRLCASARECFLRGPSANE